MYIKANTKGKWRSDVLEMVVEKSPLWVFLHGSCSFLLLRSSFFFSLPILGVVFFFFAKQNCGLSRHCFFALVVVFRFKFSALLLLLLRGISR